jgi:micrococcal nuclease
MKIQDNYIRHIYSIESIYDGDTLTAIVESGYDGLDRIKFRLKGINTAEMKGSHGMRLALAHSAKDYLTEKTTNHKVRVHSERFETGGFGRYLGTLFYENDKGEWINLNLEMIEKGIAQEYYKGASKDFGAWKTGGNE